jgi:hypothetical protein
MRAMLYALALLLAFDRTPAAARVAVSDYEVKAAYIFNLAQFVTWPAAAFEASRSPMHLCVVDSETFGAVLAKTVENEVANGHPLVVDAVRSADTLQRCHIVFVPAASNDAPAVIRGTAGRAVLTVGETATFLADGGIVRFVVIGDRVRFDINVRPATASGLSVSSRVLQVARYVQR